MQQYTGLEIAVIGMAGRFPGAGNVQAFWSNLEKGVESIQFFTEEEMLAEGEEQQNINDPLYVRANGFIDDKEYFDSAFFNYRPDEAKVMDPQMRVFHECVWQALEDAGINPAETKNKIGLFAGAPVNINWAVYTKLVLNREGMVDEFSASQLSNARYLATRISYLLNLRGPSVFLDTTCSTSLIAIQQACKSILLGDCNMALAGGVSITNRSKRGYLYQEGLIHSKDGHCRTFDAASSGTVPSEGAAVVVLKSLKNALKDGDNIYAIIKGWGINNDGSNKVGFTAPSVDGQAEAILTAQKWAKTEPASITYIEAHGTATELGDPIEVEALNRAFGKSEEKYCALGSVKSNIGHPDSAAGVAGFIKAVLAIKHRQIPPSLHFKTPNPEINFTGTPFYVNTTLKEWKNDKYPLRAGVSSFGIGGTNAHVILEEAPAQPATSPGQQYQLMIFSGKTPAALQRNIENFRQYINKEKDLNAADIAYTLQLGRSPMACRAIMVCSNTQEAADLLAAGEIAGNTIPFAVKTKPRVVFMFSGQGSQYINMCRDLYTSEPAFKNEVDACFEILKKQTGKNLAPVVFPTHEAGDTGEINNTANTQPALFIIEYALARLLMKWGIEPACMIGHSLGEYVAACISGVFSLEHALLLVATRGELMQHTKQGTMLSIAISENNLAPFLENYNGISLAAVNSSELCVVSGEAAIISAFKTVVEKEGYKCRPVRASHAFHSHMMDEILDEFEKAIQKITINKPIIPYISNLNGQPVTYEAISRPAYWVNHLRQTVRFAAGIEGILEKKNTVFIEVGPGKALATFVLANRHCTADHAVVHLARHAQESGNDLQHLLKGIGNLWLQGIEPNWKMLYENEVRRKISLPAYSFDKIKYPALVDSLKVIAGKQDVQSFINNKGISEWMYVPAWETSLPVPGNTPPAAGQKTNLLFSDAFGVSERLEQLFTRAGEQVITIRPGKTFQQLSTNVYSIDPGCDDDYKKIFSLPVCQTPCRVLFAWGMTAGDAEKLTAGTIKESLATGYYSLLNIVKAIAGSTNTEIEIISFTSQAHCVIHGDQLSPAKSTILAALKVIPKEHANITCRNIDISLAEMNEALIQTLYKETVETSGDESVAYRRHTRFVQTVKPVKLPAMAGNPATFVPGATYLVTGGIGGMGLFITQKTASEVKGVNFILLGRQQLPAKDEWKNWLATHNESDKLYNTIKELQLVEEMGGTVFYYKADITNKATIQNLIKDCEAAASPVRGVLHTAGIGDYAGIIYRRTREDCEKVFEAKLYGTLVLSELFAGHQLDFFILFSSVATVYAPFGQVGYVAANMFLDAFSTYTAQAGGIRMTSIGWNAWLKTGMAVKAAKAGNTTITPDNILPEEGYEILQRAIKSKLPAIHISRIKLNELAAIAAAVTALAENDHPDEQPRPYDETNEAISLTTVTEKLVELWQNFFGKTGIGPGDDFFTIGGDSLKALTMIGRVHKAFNTSITLTQFFTTPTISELAGYIFSVKSKLNENGGDEKYNAIPKAVESEYYQLSSVQKRLYFLHELDKTSLAYNMPLVLHLTGNLDKEALAKVFNSIMERHESLRTSFKIINGKPVQKISAHTGIEIEYFKAENEAIQGVIKQFIRPFDLSTGDLLRVGVIDIAPSEHILMVDMHHIIADGIAHGVLVNDFIALYNNEQLPAMELQYKDYAEWQQSESQQHELAKQKEFWLQEFAEEPAILQLPADYDRPAIKSYEGDSVSCSIDVEETKALKTIAENEGTTLYMVILSVYTILLGKLGNQEDIVIGTPVAGRHHADLEKIIGMFVNTLALRNYPKGELSFREFLTTVKAKTLKSFENQAYPYEVLIDELKVTRNTGRNPLFDVMFSYLNFEEPELQIPGLVLKPYESGFGVSQFDLTLWAIESNGQLFFKFEYATALFVKATIEKFIACFKSIITQVAADAGKKISAIDILSNEEKHKLLHEFNNTTAWFPAEETLVSLFEKQVSKTPANVAVRNGSNTISYLQLNNTAGKIAAYLQHVMHVKKGDLVALLLQRGDYLIPAIFGIIKAGAAYLPIDPAYPAERTRTIINDSQVNIIISRGRHLEGLNLTADRVVNLDEDLNAIMSHEENLQPVNVSSSNLAYVIYTSGSTGTPKGVMITHQAIVNRLLWMQKAYPLSGDDVILQKTPVVFDVSVWELFWWSLTGASVCLLQPGGEKEPQTIIDTIRENNITTLHFVPSMLSAFLLALDKNFDFTELESLRRVFASGEALKADHVNQFGKTIHRHCGTRLINLYGPTEATVDVSYYECTFDTTGTSVPIGKPIDNTRLHILDKHQQLVPVGVAGELCIAGVGLARGYLGNEKLTNEKFITGALENENRLYRTGDLAKWRSDGNIEYLGRIDEQVKIRGFRIEPGEIEHCMRGFENIQEAVVITKERNGDKYLAGYYVAGVAIDNMALESYLSAKLPYYMVPSTFLQLERLPLTANGKLNRKALPETRHAGSHKYVAPRNDMERQVQAMWQQVLGTEETGVNDDFFTIGGNSLKLIELFRLVDDQYPKIVKVMNLFENRTIATLAAYIKANTGSAEPEPGKKEKVILEF